MVGKGIDALQVMRKERIDLVYNYVLTNPEIDIDFLIAKIAYEHGIRNDTIYEYIDILFKNDKIEISIDNKVRVKSE